VFEWSLEAIIFSRQSSIGNLLTNSDLINSQSSMGNPLTNCDELNPKSSLWNLVLLSKPVEEKVRFVLYDLGNFRSSLQHFNVSGVTPGIGINPAIRSDALNSTFSWLFAKYPEINCSTISSAIGPVIKDGKAVAKAGTEISTSITAESAMIFLRCERLSVSCWGDNSSIESSSASTYSNLSVMLVIVLGLVNLTDILTILPQQV